jgi:hypothetical protein
MGNAIYNEVKLQKHRNRLAKIEIIEEIPFEQTEEIPVEQEEFPSYILWILGFIPITTLICCFLCISCRRR